MSVELHAGDLLCAARMPEANESLQIAARAVPLSDILTFQAESPISVACRSDGSSAPDASRVSHIVHRIKNVEDIPFIASQANVFCGE